MKKMKKTLSLMMMVMMMVSMTAMTVFGATGDLTINVGTSVSINGKDFDAYLILEGVYDDNAGEMIYSNDFDHASYEYVIASALNLSGTPVVKDIIDALDAYDSNDEKLREVANSLYANIISRSIVETGTVKASSDSFVTFQNLEEGYYLIVDRDNQFPAMLTNVMDIGNTISIKADVPTMEKWIQHNENATEGGISGGAWGKVADNQIGDTVYFKLETTLPTIITDYEGYVYILADAMDSSLTFDENEGVTFYLTDETKTSEVPSTILNKYFHKLSTGENGFIYYIDVHGLHQYKDITFNNYQTLYVYYQAELNENAYIYSDANVNTATLTYSNKPSDSWESSGGTNTLLDDLKDIFDEDYVEDNFGDIVDEEGTGDRVNDLSSEIEDALDNGGNFGDKESEGNPVYDYTFEVVLNKIDDSNAFRDGATFTLEVWNGSSFDKVNLQADPSSDETRFILGNGSSNEFIMPKGTITMVGLDDGLFSGDTHNGGVFYKMVEEDAPTGLTGITEAFYFKITSTFGDGDTSPTVTIEEVDVNGKKSENVDGVVGVAGVTVEKVNEALTVTVVNTSGSMLPSTGGVGTVIFQVVGAGMVLAAGALLMMKKKQS